MKKSELRNIIKELIKEQYGTGTEINISTCIGGITDQNFCIPNSFNGQVGDTFIVNTSFNPGHVGKGFFIRNISNNSCNTTMNGVQTTVSPNTGTCTNCCIYDGYEWGSFTPSGACWNSCSGGIQVPGCTDPTAQNYDPNATVDDGSCIAHVLGCLDPTAVNYYPGVTAGCQWSDPLNLNDWSCCQYEGCNDPTATNYDPTHYGCNGNPNDTSCCTYGSVTSTTDIEPTDIEPMDDIEMQRMKDLAFKGKRR